METNAYRPVTVGDWMLTYLLMCIPLVNFILLLVWAFGGGTPVSKANWAKASLLWMIIGLGLWLLLIVLGVATLALFRFGQSM